MHLATWAMVRAEYAHSLAQQLRREYGLYRTALGEESNVEVSRDGHTARVRARLTNQPPVEQWSLIFGDILHNYRAALDAFAWDLAQLDGRALEPHLARKLYFPIERDEKRWTKLVDTTLSTMPKIVVRRLLGVQPFRHERPDDAIGVLLHDLEIQDKHRASLEMRLRFASRTTFAIHWKPRDGPEELGEFDYQELAAGETVHDGNDIFEIHHGTPIEWMRVPKLPMDLVAVRDRTDTEVFSLIRLIDRQVVATLMTVCVGAPLDEGWFDYFQGTGQRPAGHWWETLVRAGDEAVS